VDQDDQRNTTAPRQVLQPLIVEQVQIVAQKR